MYRGEDEFVAGTVAFVRAGLAVDAPVLVAVVAPKIRLLHAALGADADRVRFADMTALGQNPARIIPAWREFLDTHLRPPDDRLVGVGEPIWGRPAARSRWWRPQLHEALLNVAFDGGPGRGGCCARTTPLRCRPRCSTPRTPAIPASWWPAPAARAPTTAATSAPGTR